MSRKFRNLWILGKDRGLEDSGFGKSKSGGAGMELGIVCARGQGGGSEHAVALGSVKSMDGCG